MSTEFESWYENAIWGNEDFKEGCWRAWDESRAALAQQAQPTEPAQRGATYWTPDDQLRADAKSEQRINELAAAYVAKQEAQPVPEPAALTDADLRYVSSVLDDVLADISDWEDKALAEAVTDAKARIERAVRRQT